MDTINKEENMKTLAKWNGNHNHNNAMFPEFPSLFDDFLTRDFFQTPFRAIANNSVFPAVNLKETNSTFELEMAAPGLEKKDFKIELNQDLLSISVEKEISNEEKNEDGNFSRKEFSYHSFQRSFSLPKDKINEDGISANYTDGILHVTIPKKEASKSWFKRLIPIK